MLKVLYGVNPHFDNILRQAEDPAHFFIKELGIEDMKLSLMVDPMLAMYAAGACGETIEGEICVMITPFVHLMEDVTAVVAHELVHCQQIYRGDLKTDIRTRTISWKGKPYPVQPNQPNRDCPWEVEAYEAMYTMANLYYAQRGDRDPFEDMMSMIRRMLK